MLVKFYIRLNVNYFRNVSGSVFTCKKIESDLNQVRKFLGANLTAELYTEVQVLFTHAHDRSFSESKHSQREKFDKLLANRNGTEKDVDSTRGINTDKWVVNLSDRTLQEDAKSVLKRGMNFCVTPPTVPVNEIIASTEAACSQMNDKSAADSLRAEVVKVLRQSKTPKSNISSGERKALYTLCKEKDIVILPADKGRTTVVLNRSEYEKKMDR
ncbi:uncharacterized protein LOC128558909 [Mercenaria mercenaria]|uniref:uncharacterized protein LOC128558909 n=1 Tax=Mercenaria mercenaria TaxID=6596 RepID=UPI00234E3BC9|nr:uncharacterized protein LOC128558909 [Mercenaria mercenaria]